VEERGPAEGPGRREGNSASAAPLRIRSGGQSGVDRAALDVAREKGLPAGGWCPAGRAAEDGPIAGDYPLRETPSPDPAQRTAWNVRDADATLVLSREAPRGGTALAMAEAERRGRPLLAVRLSEGDEGRAVEERAVAQVRAWLARHRVRELNVAGPRESEEPGIGGRAAGFLRHLLAEPG